ncbi:unnamed protein product [Rhodiola kirilowii]
MELESQLDSVDGVVQEIMRLHRSLPPRPAIDEVEAAKDLLLRPLTCSVRLRKRLRKARNCLLEMTAM